MSVALVLWMVIVGVVTTGSHRWLVHRREQVRRINNSPPSRASVIGLAGSVDSHVATASRMRFTGDPVNAAAGGAATRVAVASPVVQGSRL